MRLEASGVLACRQPTYSKGLRRSIPHLQSYFGLFGFAVLGKAVIISSDGD